MPVRLRSVESRQRAAWSVSCYMARTSPEVAVVAGEMCSRQVVGCTASTSTVLWCRDKFRRHNEVTLLDYHRQSTPLVVTDKCTPSAVPANYSSVKGTGILIWLRLVWWILLGDSELDISGCCSFLILLLPFGSNDRSRSKPKC
jgi:hypothetical protein